MTEENDDDDIWADDETEAGREEDDWEQNDPFFSMDQSFSWVDNEGNYHEIYNGELPDEAEIRQMFDTPEEAASYIDEILTGASMYFEVVETEDDQYAVYYMGGSE